MADKPVEKSVVLSVLDRNWIRKSLELQRASLVRSRSREMSGSPVLEIREQEVAQINAILAKL